jgi:DNA-binding phage protein
MGRRETQYICSLDDDRLQRKNRAQMNAETISNDEETEASPVGPPQKETEKEASPEGSDNHLWGLYMRAQYSGYKDTEDLSGSEESLLLDESILPLTNNETLITEGFVDYDYLTPQLEETNVAETDREIRRLAREEARVKGLAQAKEKARLAKEKLAKKLSFIQATRSQAEAEQLVNHDTTADTTRDRDDDRIWEETDGENEKMDGEQKVVLINTGPHRWTPTITTKYMEKFLPLEGKLWVHPRTKRLYEITHVFFYEKEQVAARAG